MRNPSIALFVILTAPACFQSGPTDRDPPSSGPTESTPPSDSATESAAAIAQTWPADGTSGVPPALPLAIVHFADAPESPSIRIERLRDRQPIAIWAENSECEPLGFEDGTCIQVSILESLESNAEHALVVDGHESRFRTGSDLASVGPASLWSFPPCALDEVPVPIGCALVLDDRIEIQTRTTRPTRLFAESLHGGARAIAARGEAVLHVRGLPANTEIRLFIRAIELDGSEHLTEFTASTTEPLAPIVITEVRFNPVGPEPAQEFVELLNRGAEPYSLEGFSLSDHPSKEGDLIETETVLPPGGRILLVSDRFDPEHPDDGPVPSGTPLLTLGTSLASGGLSNAGEALYLRDADQRRVSAVPAVPPPLSGVCRVRIILDGRSGEAGSFGYDPNQGCTPGRASGGPAP